VDYHAIGVGAHDQGVGVLQREGTIAGGNVGAHEAPWRQRIMPPLAAMSSSSIHPGWITESPHVISRYQKTMPAADEPAVLEAQYPAHLRIVVTVPGVLRLQQFAPHK
jgi:hypothetical protein